MRKYNLGHGASLWPPAGSW